MIDCHIIPQRLTTHPAGFTISLMQEDNNSLAVVLIVAPAYSQGPRTTRSFCPAVVIVVITTVVAPSDLTTFPPVPAELIWATAYTFGVNGRS